MNLHKRSRCSTWVRLKKNMEFAKDARKKPFYSRRMAVHGHRNFDRPSQLTDNLSEGLKPPTRIQYVMIWYDMQTLWKVCWMETWHNESHQRTPGKPPWWKPVKIFQSICTDLFLLFFFWHFSSILLWDSAPGGLWKIDGSYALRSGWSLTRPFHTQPLFGVSFGGGYPIVSSYVTSFLIFVVPTFCSNQHT